MSAERRPRPEGERMVREQERSGMSLREFVAARGVNAHTLSWWRWRLRSEKVQEPPPSSFVPVVVQACAEDEEAHARQVEVELPNGVVLRFGHRLDARGLRELAAAFGMGE